jgi:succinate dehydrogenase hydrophobic anchor subunit
MKQNYTSSMCMTISGFDHWIFQRISAFLIFSISLNVFVFNTITLAYLLVLFVIAHGNLGVQTLIEDYTHSEIFMSYNITCLHLASIITTKGIFIGFLLVV